MAKKTSNTIEAPPVHSAPSATAQDLDNLRREVETAPAPVANALAQDPELVGDFVNESREHIATVETQILVLERDPSAADPLNAAFRSFHTIKGLAGFLDLHPIRDVAHEVETLLDRARNHEISLTPVLIDVVLESADHLKKAIAWVESGLGGDPGPGPATGPILKRVRDALEGKLTGPGAATVAEPVAERSAAPEAAPRTADAAFTVRVDSARLDYMVDMVGELVIAQSLVSHSPDVKALQNGPLGRHLQQMGRITAEVQRVAMSMRMTPMNQLFTRMTRLVRDLTRKNGKTVRLDLVGGDTELDRTIIEQIADPLMHMVRNSLDHGLELPAERIAKGKPAEGTMRLGASHQAGNIVIEITDDGRGLNTTKILQKARERGLVSEGQTPSENEIFHLIFEPGFSTAEKITDVSGRGVGMDVVRRQIQNLRGRVDIQSTIDRGATFLLRLPLTLAIIDGLIVSVGGERYIMPISSVREMIRPTADMLFTIEGRAEMAMIRGDLLRVVRLNRRFGIPNSVQDPCEGLFVIVEVEARRYCVLVDKMIGKQEVVIKTLGEMFREVAGISGGAILGDGRVGLILDLPGRREGISDGEPGTERARVQPVSKTSLRLVRTKSH